MRRFVPNCSLLFRRGARVLGVFAFSIIFFQAAGRYNRGIALRYEKCHRTAAQDRKSCLLMPERSRPACIASASRAEDTCLDAATDPGGRRAEILSLLALKALLYSLLIFWVARWIGWFFTPTLERL